MNEHGLGHGGTRRVLRRGVAWLRSVFLRSLEVPAFTARPALADRRIAFGPIVVVVSWWLTCAIVWAVGWPIEFERTNLVPVLLLITACCLGAFVGYWIVMTRGHAVVATPLPPGKLPRPVLIGLCALVALLGPWATIYSGYHVWEIGSALTDPGRAFALAAERVAEGTSSRLPFVAAQAVLAPMVLMVIPVTATRWFESRRHGYALLVALVVAASMSVLVGRSYYVATAAMLVAVAWLVARIRTGRAVSRRVVIMTAVAVVPAAVLFALSKAARGGGSARPCSPGEVSCTPGKSTNVVDLTLTYLASYSSQSVEGLSRALDGQWRFGGGYRHSPALSSMGESIGLPRVDVITDQLDDHGWSDTAYWSSGWALAANDLPWFLVPVAMAFLAALVAFAFRKTIQAAEPVATTVFCHGLLVLILMAQNGVLAGDGPSYVGFLILVAVFLWRHGPSRSLAARVWARWGSLRSSDSSPGLRGKNAA